MGILIGVLLCSLSLLFVRPLAQRRGLVLALLALLALLAAWGQAPALGVRAQPLTGLDDLFSVYLPLVRKGFPTPPPTPTSTPTPMPTATPQGRLCEDFSDPASGWKIEDTAEVGQGYQDGEYRIYIKEADKGGGAGHPTFSGADYRVEVDARFADDTYGAYGLLFAGTEDGQSAYMFLVWEKGYWAFWRLLGGQSEILFDYTTSPHILPGQSTNHLAVVRQGWQIRLSINGQEVAVFDDFELLGNLGVGVLAGAEDLSGVDARFDNFCVTPLQP